MANEQNTQSNQTPSELDTSMPVPEQAHGGDNSTSKPQKQGERGNGAQRLQQKK